MPDPHLSWAVRASRADTSAALDRLMDDWYGQVKADRGLHAAIGFDSYMECRDWDSAKHSIERHLGPEPLRERCGDDGAHAVLPS